MSEFTRAEVFPQAEGFTKTPGWLDWYTGPTEQFAQLIQSERRRYEKLVREANIKPD